MTALACNVLLAGLKFVIGWRLGSLGVLSDAVHSLLDGAASVIALTAEVQQLLGDHRVRAVAMSSTDGLVRGMEALDTGAAISV
ncbi:MAG: hypothetical protein EBT75_09900, partial [Proteobacteria bacterium]|nr:hypothetical protein [Pseudomonadota bacterium]